MRHCYLLIAIIFFSGFLTSCEEPVDFRLDDKPELQVTSYFSANKALVVTLSETRQVTSNKGFKFIEDAEISVYAGDEFIEILRFIPDENTPYYQSTLLNPVVDEIYRIEVIVPGYQPVTATNYIPEAVPIEDVEFLPVVDNDIINETRITFDVAVSIQDPSEYDNYYHLSFYQEMIEYSVDEYGDTTYLDSNEAKAVEVSLRNPDFPAVVFGKSGFLIKDNSFNGEFVIIPLSGQFIYDPSKYKLGNFVVELRTVSEAYYNYLISSLGQSNSSQNPLNDQMVINDNIDNGIGVFAGFSASVKSTRLEN